MRLFISLTIAIFALAAAQPSLHAAHTADQSASQPALQPPADLVLAQTYAPLLYFHEKERYRPQDIRVMLDHARLRQSVNNIDATILDSVTIDDLATAPADAYIDLWYGQDDTSRYLNYTAHGSYYDLNGLAEAYPVTAYARVFHAGDGRIAIQYWLFYYYNDWYNKHEGDWEMVQVELDAEGQPARAVYAQHQDGSVRPWDAVSKDGTHPRAYVAQGSHATYFVGDTLYFHGDIANTPIAVPDRTGSIGPVMPMIQLISEGDPAWLNFGGMWGERAFAGFSGPTGPSKKGTKWSNPFEWAAAQHSDAEEWYHRHVRAETNALPDAAALALTNAPLADTIVESPHNRQTTIVYELPDASTRYELELRAQQTLAPTLVVEWPDAAAGTVTRREYDLSLAEEASVATRLCSACDFVLEVDANGDGTSDRRVPPARTSSRNVDFDPPESVVFYLPFEQIVAGLLIALFGAVLPSAAYAFGVWWLDRYEKEPARLLIVTFLWGALPGALVAIVARFLVTGVLTPAISESLKFAAIGFIFTRHRREFDDILDGIVYGALAGIGFAMTTNLLTYVFGFLFGGFEFLRLSVLVEGVAFGLNEAYYGAVIGIGFGVSRWAKDPPLRKMAPWLGLAAAIILHMFTDFWRDLAVGDQSGLVVIPFLATWAGIIAVVAIALLSIRKEQQTIRRHLQAEFDLRTFTQDEASFLATPAGRARMVLNGVRAGPAGAARALQMQNLITKLAYRRRELEVLGRNPASDAVAANLRQQIAKLRPKPRENR